MMGRGRGRYTMPFCFALVVGTGCTPSSGMGEVRTSSENPVVTVGGGYAEIGAGVQLFVFYIIDTTTQHCWARIGGSIGEISCCDVRKVPEAKPHIPWLSDQACGGPVPAPVQVAPSPEP